MLGRRSAVLLARRRAGGRSVPAGRWGVAVWRGRDRGRCAVAAGRGVLARGRTLRRRVVASLRRVLARRRLLVVAALLLRRGILAGWWILASLGRVRRAAVAALGRVLAVALAMRLCVVSVSLGCPEVAAASAGGDATYVRRSRAGLDTTLE